MPATTLRSPLIFVVDDQAANIRYLEGMLERAGYDRILGITDPLEVPAHFAAEAPDLMLLDLHMPGLDGFGVLEAIAPYLSPDVYRPILVLTADYSPAARQKALARGAKDFLTKPFDSTEVLLRIRNLLEARFLYLALQQQNDLLERKVRERTAQLEEAHLEIVERLALAAEFRDDATHEHTRRVGDLSARLAQRMGFTSDAVELIRRAATLHDLGKIAVPDNILLKLDQLTKDEFEVVKNHTAVGARILSGSRHPLLQLAEQIALTHHERWDGNGYSPGVSGEDIPIVGRIVAVVDVFDALTHTRPYKRPWTVSEAIGELRREAGRQFDPRVVDEFVTMIETEGVDVPVVRGDAMPPLPVPPIR